MIMNDKGMESPAWAPVGSITGCSVASGQVAFIGGGAAFSYAPLRPEPPPDPDGLAHPDGWTGAQRRRLR